MRLTAARLEVMVEQATVDCYSESEAVTGLFSMIEKSLQLPFETTILRFPVTVERVGLDDGEVDRGVFRLRNFPIWEREDLIRWTFWSLCRGVVSHDSALEFHGIGDLIPHQIHLTVPPNFRKRDGRVVLHRGLLERSDVERNVGFRVTAPLRTLLDVADSDLDSDRFGDAVLQAIRYGRVRPTQLTDGLEDLSERGRRRLEEVLRFATAA